ncbi:MAG TPA: polysaccharide deacetylase family protein [Acidimicrobiales bacterium]|nr:polysaccharide deacetylase family protein [Acidimicrobiales bacterium]
MPDLLPGHRRIVQLGAAGAVAAAVAHVGPGAVAWRQARCRLLPGLSGVGRADHVALTFDDGPDPESTPLILDLLDTFGWRATFFCLGTQARRSPELVRELVDRGHEIGVHGRDHRSQLRRTAPGVINDLRDARSLLEDLTGQPIKWFRPPYGAVSGPTLVAAHHLRLRLILWTTWGHDWADGATGASVAGHIHRTMVDGATVLLHDSDITSTPRSWQATVDALPLLAGDWHGRGLDVGPLGDHF